MHISLVSMFRSSIAATVIWALSLPAFAAEQTRRIQGEFFCNAQSKPTLFNLPGTPVWLPSSLDVIVAGAGKVTHMAHPVVCYSDDEHLNVFNPLPPFNYIGVGQLTSIFRDRNGDTLTMALEMLMDEKSTDKDHPITFGGSFVITGGTGRFAGAKGQGLWSGWANNDDLFPADPAKRSSAQGYWRFSGTLVLPE